MMWTMQCQKYKNKVTVIIIFFFFLLFLWYSYNSVLWVGFTLSWKDVWVLSCNAPTNVSNLLFFNRVSEVMACFSPIRCNFLRRRSSQRSLVVYHWLDEWHVLGSLLYCWFWCVQDVTIVCETLPRDLEVVLTGSCVWLLFIQLTCIALFFL